jgi:hypothetical protein
LTNILLTENLSEPLNGAISAEVAGDIDSGTGNLRVEPLPGDNQLLASGTLQYFERPRRADAVDSRRLRTGHARTYWKEDRTAVVPRSDAEAVRHTEVLYVAMALAPGTAYVFSTGTVCEIVQLG